MSKNKLIPAPIDEKNVTTDWIEEIFDGYNCVCNGQTYTGFVKNSVCCCVHYRNLIIWQINKDFSEKASESWDELIKRLKEHDAPPLVVKYDESMKDELMLAQKFYFEDE